MFNSVDTFAIFALLVRLELSVQGLKASRPIGWRVGIEHPCVKKCATTIGPKASHPNVCTSVRFCVGSLVAKCLTSQGLKWRFQLNVMVHLSHTFCKECGRVIMAHMDEARQFAWSIVNLEPQGQVGGRFSSGQQ